MRSYLSLPSPHPLDSQLQIGQMLCMIFLSARDPGITHTPGITRTAPSPDPTPSTSAPSPSSASAAPAVTPTVTTRPAVNTAVNAQQVSGTPRPAVNAQQVSGTPRLAVNAQQVSGTPRPAVSAHQVSGCIHLHAHLHAPACPPAYTCMPTCTRMHAHQHAHACPPACRRAHRALGAR